MSKEKKWNPSKFRKAMLTRGHTSGAVAIWLEDRGYSASPVSVRRWCKPGNGGPIQTYAINLLTNTYIKEA